jgi:hypothetical protein
VHDAQTTVWIRTDTSLASRLSSEIPGHGLRCLCFLLFKAGLHRVEEALRFRQQS